jgi:protein CpxP
MFRNKDEAATQNRQRRGSGWMLAGLIVAATATGGLAGAAMADGRALQAMHGIGQAPADPAAMNAHFDAVIARILPDATAEQKAGLKAVATAFHANLRTVHSGLGHAHGEMLALVRQPNIDRAAFEALRVQHMRQMDEASVRMMKNFADAAELLTPAQRVRLVEHLKQMH